MQKTFYTIFTGIIILAVSNANSQPNIIYDLNHYIENPALYQENQQPSHVPVCPFNSEGQAVSEDFTLSPYYLSLNGTWSFHWYSTPYQLPDGFYETGFKQDNWNSIQVPGTWQMQGFGHKIYRNIPLEFAPYDPPKVPDHFNPTGLYLRNFDLPENWADRKIFIHFDGVKSVYWMWVNGRYVGFDKGSMTPGEWDITGFVHSGTNQVAVKVIRWSDGTYLEDQDMWRFSGIYRGVYLYATPRIHIRDLFITTDLDDDYENASINVAAQFHNYDSIEHNNLLLDVKLLDTDDKSILTKNLRVGTLLGNDEKTVEMSYKIDNPLKWSAEKPNLYHFLLIIRDPTGEILEVIEQHVGFREIEIKNAQLLINGVAVKFKGVNRHEHDPELGRTMTREMIEMDLRLMKQLNVNAIRTSHYPDDPVLYDLADKYGIYICDEVNAECHEGETYLPNQPGWDVAFMDRTRRFFNRDKNHPSVILWSTGNECGYGPVHDKMAAFLKKNDPTRVLYHQGNIPANGDAPFADVNGIRYPTQEQLRMVGRQTDRPVIMGEYSHAMGNGLGGFDEYWNVIYSEKTLQGGFIWDWVNQGLKFDMITTPDASPYHHQAVIMGNPEIVDGYHGKALAFSGLDDFAEIYNDPVFNKTGNTLTLETWVYPRGYHDVNPMISKALSYELTQRDPDSLSFRIRTGNREMTISGFLPRDWNYNWHHVAGIYDGSRMNLYIDGMSVASGRASGKIDRNPHPVCIGKNHLLNHESQGWFISSYIYDQVRIYPAAINIKESGYFDQTDDNAGKSLLWLNLDEFSNVGNFLSYGATPQGSGTMDGVVSAYREPQPEAYQMKQSQAPVYVTKVGRDIGKLRIENRFNFTDLSEVDAIWQLLENDKSIESGTLKLQTVPQQSEMVDMPFKRPKFKAGATYIFRITFNLKKKTDWAEKGYELCFYEFPVENLEEHKDIILQEETTGFNVNQDDNLLKINANNNYFEINLSTGQITSIRNNNTEIISHASELNVWRRPVMNEWSQWGVNEAEYWYKYGLDSLIHQVTGVEKDISGFDCYIKFDLESRSFSHPQLVFHHTLIYDVYSSGDLLIHHTILPDIEVPDLYSNDWFPLSYLQKIGLKFILSPDATSLEWFGRGPFETYPDRKTGAKTGRYQVNISDIKIPYLIPQDFDNRTDVRWAAIRAADGRGLLITSDSWFNVSIDPYKNLNDAWYPFQLIRTDHPVLNIDHSVTGIGGTPVRVRPVYRTYPQRYEYKILIRPFSRNPDLFKMSNIDF